MHSFFLIRECYFSGLGLIFLFCLSILGWKYSCFILKKKEFILTLFVPFIKLSLTLNIWLELNAAFSVCLLILPLRQMKHIVFLAKSPRGSIENLNLDRKLWRVVMIWNVSISSIHQVLVYPRKLFTCKPEPVAGVQMVGTAWIESPGELLNKNWYRGTQACGPTPYALSFTFHSKMGPI